MKFVGADVSNTDISCEMLTKEYLRSNSFSQVFDLFIESIVVENSQVMFSYL